MTIDLQELKTLYKRCTRLLPMQWESYYHNRTETWSITHKSKKYDAVNDIENLVAIAPNGSGNFGDIFDFIAFMANNSSLITSALEQLEELRPVLERFNGVKGVIEELERAEKVEKQLVDANEILLQENATLREAASAFAVRNVVLAEALKWYANEENYECIMRDRFETCEVWEEGGAKAQEALGG